MVRFRRYNSTKEMQVKNDYEYSPEARKAGIVVAVWAAVLAVLLLGLAFWGGNANAADQDRVNILKTRPIQEQCEVRGRLYYEGLLAKSSGFPRAVRELSPADIESLEHSGALPDKSSMVMPGYNSMNENEKRFVDMLLFGGWDAGVRGESDESVNAKAQSYFEQCLQDLAARKEVKGVGSSSLVKVASSQALYDPRLTETHFCDKMAEVVEGVAVLKLQGVTMEKLYADYPLPGHWSPEFQDYVRVVVNEIYAASDVSAYLEAFVAACRVSK